ncbi:hypothetical protein GGX14DRAFT_350813 [Mycena pura]|uniref:Uncharacterized protein n=1 Tax=Mycena pura TaxID=153505 RepID=A0AAD7E2J5_9AGAR|nr:hypothetical protein GGX14DRAFT_350813 [Mycena pura]
MSLFQCHIRVILRSGLVRSASFVLLQGVPSTISLDQVRSAILDVDGVHSVHELHDGTATMRGVWMSRWTCLATSRHISSPPYRCAATRCTRSRSHVDRHNETCVHRKPRCPHMSRCRG